MPLALAAFCVVTLVVLMYYAHEIVVTGALDKLAHWIPVIGGYIARGTRAAADAIANLWSDYIDAGIHALIGWFVDLANGLAYVLDYPARWITAAVDAIDHLTHVTVHKIVHAFVDPLHESLARVDQEALDALHGIDELGRRVETEITTTAQATLDTAFKGIDAIARNLERDFTVGIDRIGSELNTLANDLERELGTDVRGLRSAVDDLTGRIPFADIAATSVGLAGLAALVHSITAESGLDNPECRGKVKNLCTTDPNLLANLLAGATALGFAFSLRELYPVARGILSTTEPLIRDAA